MTRHTHSSSSLSDNHDNRCRHISESGRQCRLRVQNPATNLCFRHASLLHTSPVSSQNDLEDLSADLLPELSDFASSVDIRQFLARLLILVSKGRISPRRASVLAYISNQLLHSHRAHDIEADRETILHLDEPPQVDLTGMPRPGRPSIGEHQSYAIFATTSEPKHD